MLGKMKSVYNYCRKLWDLHDRLFEAKDPSSLAVFRISYGLLMMLDIPHERGLSIADKKWNKAEICHFPLIESISPLPYDWMCIVYFIMWLGSIGIMLGYRYYLSCSAFIIPYWYLILLEKGDWNNHTYLFGLIAILLFSTNANASWSLDQILNNTKSTTVPSWNYFILRFQVFILYFMAGVKKINYDWLSGYSMRHLSLHWVFDPFRLLLPNNIIDVWIIHVFGFLLDLSSGFGLYCSKTRPITFLFLFFFHFMNSRMFTIGMFPYVGIATMFIFSNTDWPKVLLRKLKLKAYNSSEPEPGKNKSKISNFRKYLILTLILLHMITQLFLPFSHFITKGYNGWTNGLYGYSWDMMVNSYDTSMVVVRVKDNDSGENHFLDTDEWTLDEKWTRHVDMVKQLSHCVKRNLQRKRYFGNISIYADVWCSMNGRFHQRMIDPRMDLLTAEWSPFRNVPWVLPLLTNLSHWREKMQEIEEQIEKSEEYNGVIFLADFPGYYLDNFVTEDLVNVSLTVLEGRVRVELENKSTLILNNGNEMSLPSNIFHNVYTISSTPACYYYKYYKKEGVDEKAKKIKKRTLIVKYLEEVRKSVYLVCTAVLRILLKFFNRYNNYL